MKKKNELVANIVEQTALALLLIGMAWVVYICISAVLDPKVGTAFPYRAFAWPVGFMLAGSAILSLQAFWRWKDEKYQDMMSRRWLEQSRLSSADSKRVGA